VRKSGALFCVLIVLAIVVQGSQIAQRAHHVALGAESESQTITLQQ
jgi:hypothetical protein